MMCPTLIVLPAPITLFKREIMQLPIKERYGKKNDNQIYSFNLIIHIPQLLSTIQASNDCQVHFFVKDLIKGEICKVQGGKILQIEIKRACYHNA